MYIAEVPNRNCPPAIVLRESFLDKGKIRERTIASLFNWPTARSAALRPASSCSQ